MKLIVFLSSGRCGTQFFTTYLHEAAAEHAVVVHEPIKAQYVPKQTLRAPDLDLLLPRFPVVERHFGEIARIVARGQVYVETGWPVFPWIPLLLRRFGDDALVVHLTRNPVRFAFSLATHHYYSPQGRERRFVQLAELHPTDPGVKYPHYATNWDALNPVEKSFFQWLEINAWAEELKAADPVRFITIRSEDALARPQMLLDGMIERRPELNEAFPHRPEPPKGVVDRYARGIGFEVESLRYAPEVEQLARRYGYSMDVDEAGVAGRFFTDDS